MGAMPAPEPNEDATPMSDIAPSEDTAAPMPVAAVRDLYAAGEQGAALAELRRRAERTAEEDLLHDVLAFLAGEAGAQERLKTSAAHFDGDAETDPGRLSDLGMALFLQGEVQRAKDLLHRALQGGRRDSVTQARLASCFYVQDEIASAIAYYEQALAIAPQRPAWLHNLGVCHLREGDTLQAVEYFDRVLEIDPNYPPTPENRARALRQLGRTEEIVAQMRQRIAEDPEAVQPRLQLAGILQHTAQHTLALEELEKAANLGQFKGDPEEDAVLQAWRAVWRTIANVYAARQQHLNVLRAVKTAERKAEPDVPLLKARGHALVELRKYESARSDVARLRELGADIAAATLEGERLSEQNALSDSMAVLRECHEQFPNTPQVKTQLAHVLTLIGELEEAEQLYLEAGEISPLSLLAVANMKARGTSDDLVLEKLLPLADSAQLPDNLRANINFGLANIYERKKDYDEAFRRLDIANKTMRPRIPYEREQMTRQVNDIRRVFTPELIARYAEAGHPSRAPIFIVGMPRSGTTLLESILSAHPEVFGAGELPYVTQVSRRMGLNLNPKRGYPQCIPHCPAHAFRDAGAYYLQQTGELTDLPYTVDKMPHNFLHVGLIRLMFPNAMVIHIRREPRDVAVSNYFQNFKMNQGMMGFAYDLTDIGYHLADYARITRHWRKVLGDWFHEVNYEDLVADQEGEVKRILDKIGLAWDGRMREFFKQDRAVRTASVTQVRQPVYTSSTEKWRRYAAWLEPLEAVLEEEGL